MVGCLAQLSTICLLSIKKKRRSSLFSVLPFLFVDVHKVGVVGGNVVGSLVFVWRDDPSCHAGWGMCACGFGG